MSWDVIWHGHEKELKGVQHNSDWQFWPHKYRVDQTFFGPTNMCCLFIILGDSDEDGAEGWIAPVSHPFGPVNMRCLFVIWRFWWRFWWRWSRRLDSLCLTPALNAFRHTTLSISVDILLNLSWRFWWRWSRRLDSPCLTPPRHVSVVERTLLRVLFPGN